MGINLNSSSTLITPRDDLGLGFDGIDLEALRMGYVGLIIAPLIEANLAMGQFKKMDIKNWLQPRKTARNADGSYQRIGAEFGLGTFNTKNYGLESPVDYRDANVFGDLVDAELVAAELCRHGVLEDHEKRVIAQVEALTPVTATNKFDNDAANITLDFVSYKATFRAQCGFNPTSLVIDSKVVDFLMENGSVQDKFVGSNDRTARAITLKGLAAALGLDEVIESGGMKNSVAAPKAAALTTTWNADRGLLFRRTTAPTLRTPQFMRTIHWSGNGSVAGAAFEQYEEPQRDATVIRLKNDLDEVVINSECAMLLDDILT